MTRTLSISLVTLGDPHTLTGGYLYHRRMAEAAPAHGARLDFVSFPQRPFPIPMAYGRQVVRAVRAQRPDVVLVDSIAAAFLAPYGAALTGLKVCVIAHQPPGGIDHGRLRAATQAVLDRSLYRRASRLMVASELLAAQFAEQGFKGGVTVVPPGRDVAVSTAAPVPAGPDTDLRGPARAAVLCVANWLPRKGIVDLLDAVAGLPDGAARLHLAGDEDSEPGYAARVRRRLTCDDLAGRVVRHGRLGGQEVARLYRQADLFVLPSVREPYGTVYGEAMAAGLPVVGWRAGNLPYLARHDREGLLAEPGDVQALSAAIRTLAENPGLRARLGEAAQRRAGTFPTWEDSARTFFTVLREMS